MLIDTCEEFNLLWLPTQFWLSKVVCVCALSSFPCRHASGTLPKCGRLQPTMLQSRWFYGLGRITWSAQCTTDMQIRCNGLRASLHFRDREETQPAIGNGSHAALQACHDSGHAAQSRGVTRSLSGSGAQLPIAMRDACKCR